MFVLLLSVVSDTPVIINSPISLDVRKPNSLSLFCKAEGFPRPSIQWYKDNSSVLPTTYQIVLMNGTNQIEVPTQSSNLTITQTVISDTGDFKCLVTNGVDTQSETVQVTVQGQTFVLLLVLMLTGNYATFLFRGSVCSY